MITWTERGLYDKYSVAFKTLTWKATLWRRKIDFDVPKAFDFYKNEVTLAGKTKTILEDEITTDIIDLISKISRQ